MRLVLTGSPAAAGLTAAFGEEVGCNAVSPEAHRGFGFPGAEDLGNMFQYERDFETAYCGACSPDVSRSLDPERETFATWLADNNDRIPMS